MKKQRLGNQKGMASIVITMVTMIVISLIVLGFATVSRREQRQSLDQLLSTQAFYAAESGIEDARNVIRHRVETGQQVIAKDDCTTNNPSGDYPTGNTQTRVDGQYDVSYTCLLVDPNPDTIEYSSVSQDNIVVPLTAANPITSVRITWRPTNSPAGTPATCPNGVTNSFTPQTSWSCGYGLLRADLVPSGGALTRASLSSSQLSAFFVPTRNAAAGDVNYVASTGRANVSAANCQIAAYTECSATISNISGGSRSVTLRLSSMYQPSSLVIQGFNGATAQEITGVQAAVDATGKASDVLRRIRVRVPLTQTDGLLPGYAIQSNGSLCKRFSTTPNYFNIPADIVDADSSNPMCAATTDGAP